MGSSRMYTEEGVVTPKVQALAAAIRAHPRATKLTEIDVQYHIEWTKRWARRNIAEHPDTLDAKYPKLVERLEKELQELLDSLDKNLVTKADLLEVLPIWGRSHPAERLREVVNILNDNQQYTIQQVYLIVPARTEDGRRWWINDIQYMFTAALRVKQVNTPAEKEEAARSMWKHHSQEIIDKNGWNTWELRDTWGGKYIPSVQMPWVHTEEDIERLHKPYTPYVLTQ